MGVCELIFSYCSTYCKIVQLGRACKVQKDIARKDHVENHSEETVFGIVFGVTTLESIKELLVIISQIPKWNMKKKFDLCRLLGTTRPNNFQCIFQAKVYPALGMKIVNLKECIAHANCTWFLHALNFS